MRDRRRWHVQAPAEADRGRVTRFLIVALGLLGFVLFPGAGPAPGGTGLGVRTGAAQPPPAHTTVGRGRTTEVRRSADSPVRTERVVAVKAAEPLGASAPAQPALQPSPVPFAAPGAAAVRPAEPVTRVLSKAPADRPRGRAPPRSMGF